MNIPRHVLCRVCLKSFLLVLVWLVDSWFRQSKIASFQRQLNIYGFQRLTRNGKRRHILKVQKLHHLLSCHRRLHLQLMSLVTELGPDRGGYYHEFFLRGKPELASMIQRTKVSPSLDTKPTFNITYHRELKVFPTRS